MSDVDGVFVFPSRITLIRFKLMVWLLDDLQIFIYDGTTGERIGSVGGEKAHKGGIYAVSTLIPKQKAVATQNGHYFLTLSL